MTGTLRDSCADPLKLPPIACPPERSGGREMPPGPFLTDSVQGNNRVRRNFMEKSYIHA
jgi:hypothetical protein